MFLRKRPRGTPWSICHTRTEKMEFVQRLNLPILYFISDFLIPIAARNELLFWNSYRAFWNLVRATQNIFQRVTCISRELVKNRKRQATLWSH